MEQLLGSNASLFSDPSYRMQKRPHAVKSGEGVAFVDIGSSLGPPRKPTIAYGKERTKHVVSRSTNIFNSKGNGSSDELNLKSTDDDASSRPKRDAKGKERDNLDDDNEMIRVGSRFLPAHPNYKPSSINVVKALRFSKKSEHREPLPPVSSLGDSQDLSNPISEVIELDETPRGSSSSRQGLSEMSPTRRRNPSATQAAPNRCVKVQGLSTTKSPSPKVDCAPVKPRPRPRVVIKSAPPKRSDGPDSTPRPIVRKNGSPLRSNTRERTGDSNRGHTTNKSALASLSYRRPQAFPMSLQAKENDTDDSRSEDSSSKSKKVAIARAATDFHNPKPIPLPSPLRNKSIPRGNTFPNLSPLSMSIGKGKARAKVSDEDDTDLTDILPKRADPKPFPMSSQMLVDIGRRSNSPTGFGLQFTKRSSSDDTDTEQGHRAKKIRDSRSRFLDLHNDSHEPIEDDSIDLGYGRDPSRMCPYCDEDLPCHPTPLLQHLLARARKKSAPDPRPRNRGGLRAPLTIYISVCQRHRFESNQLPIAAKKGWPKTIDFANVPVRVRKMKRALEAIILDKDDVSDAEDHLTDETSRGPRGRSVFWREVKREVKNQGSRAVLGVKGQFASFEKTQPGYYGEQGSVIIHQTLFDLFPPSTFDASLISPLAPAEFIQRILVPEAAVRLIAQDLGVDIEDAVATLRESAQYGVAMFPDTESKYKGANVGDEMGVADRIVMERARARRKELAEEERMEEEQAAKCAVKKDGRPERLRGRAHAREDRAEVDTSDASEASATHKLWRGARQQAVVVDSESDAMSVTSSRSARVAKKGLHGRGKGVRVGSAMRPTSSDSDSMEVGNEL